MAILAAIGKVALIAAKVIVKAVAGLGTITKAVGTAAASFAIKAGASAVVARGIKTAIVTTAQTAALVGVSKAINKIPNNTIRSALSVPAYALIAGAFVG